MESAYFWAMVLKPVGEAIPVPGFGAAIFHPCTYVGCAVGGGRHRDRISSII